MRSATQIDRAPGTGFGSGLFGAVPEFATGLFGEFLSIARTAGSADGDEIGAAGDEQLRDG
ncbi:hypothetical protein [Amycolatopsis sp. NPDC051371]|uniref:hypothetical protein n=1 Tax=Amycolatopsis sp. NPDC051371 TaxID=3155800 RepID=UPI003423350A